MRHSHPSSEVKIYYGIISTGEIDIITMHWNESPECEPRFRIPFAFLEGKFSEEVCVKNSPGTQARYACLLSFDAKNYEAKQFLVQKFAAGQSVMMTVGQPGQNAPLGPGSTFSCRPKFHRHRYEEEKHYCLRSSNYFIFLTAHLGE